MANPGSLYNQIGGKAPLRVLVESFYDLVETDPGDAAVHVLHLRGHGINHLRRAQFEFYPDSLVGRNSMSNALNGKSQLAAVPGQRLGSSQMQPAPRF
jgi:truncated hemoglobin YjbI